MCFCTVFLIVRYQRGSRSLADNLKSSNPSKLHLSQDGIQDHEADDYEIPDQMEEVIGIY